MRQLTKLISVVAVCNSHLQVDSVATATAAVARMQNASGTLCASAAVLLLVRGAARLTNNSALATTMNTSRKPGVYDYYSCCVILYEI